jgi:peptidoglycan/xylan/chitin deacetylase (PgdA/CDA1 family)
MKPWWIDAARGYLSGRYDKRPERRGIRVLCYHGLVERITDPLLERNFHLLSNFRSHVRFLRRFRILPLAGLAEELSNPKPQRKPLALITFDDGYANNHLAWEILNAARLPWTLFVSTGALAREKLIWTVELSLLLLHGRAESIVSLNQAWSLKSREGRVSAFKAIRSPLKLMGADARREAMDNIRQQFPEGESQRLIHQFPSFRMFTWQEIKGLANAGVAIGSHGVDHEIHHAAQTESVRRRELTQSKAEIEENLGRPCNAFAYPNGDFNPASADDLNACDYELAFALNNDLITPGANPFLLPRLHTPASLEKLSRIFFYGPQH